MVSGGFKKEEEERQLQIQVHICIPNQVQQQRNPSGKQQPGGHARIVPGG